MKKLIFIVLKIIETILGFVAIVIIPYWNGIFINYILKDSDERIMMIWFTGFGFLCCYGIIILIIWIIFWVLIPEWIKFNKKLVDKIYKKIKK